MTKNLWTTSGTRPWVIRLIILYARTPARVHGASVYFGSWLDIFFLVISGVTKDMVHHFKPSVFRSELKKLNHSGKKKTTKAMKSKAMKKAWKQNRNWLIFFYPFSAPQKMEFLKGENEYLTMRRRYYPCDCDYNKKLPIHLQELADAILDREIYNVFKFYVKNNDNPTSEYFIEKLGEVLEEYNRTLFPPIW